MSLKGSPSCSTAILANSLVVVYQEVSLRLNGRLA